MNGDSPPVQIDPNFYTFSVNNILEGIEYRNEKDIVVYPNNTMCIAGKFVGRSDDLLSALGIPLVRLFHGNSAAVFRLPGGVRLTVFPQPLEDEEFSNQSHEVSIEKAKEDAKHAGLDRRIAELIIDEEQLNSPASELVFHRQMHTVDYPSDVGLIVNSQPSEVQTREVTEDDLDTFAAEMLSNLLGAG